MTLNKCYFLNCGNTSDNYSVFRFPLKRPWLLETWLKNCGNTDLHGLSKAELRNKFICIVHFDKKFINFNTRRSRLSVQAVPYNYLERPGIPQAKEPKIRGQKEKERCEVCGMARPLERKYKNLGISDKYSEAKVAEHGETPAMEVLNEKQVANQDEDENPNCIRYIIEDIDDQPTDDEEGIQDDDLQIVVTESDVTDLTQEASHEGAETAVDTNINVTETSNPDTEPTTSYQRTYKPKFPKRPPKIIQTATTRTTTTLAKAITIDRATQTDPAPNQRVIESQEFKDLVAKNRYVVAKHVYLQKRINRLLQIQKTYKRKLFEKLTAHMNPIAQQFLDSQIQVKKRHSTDVKLLALSIYKISGPCYRLLKKIFRLPSWNTLMKLKKSLTEENKQDESDDEDELESDEVEAYDDLDEANDFHDKTNHSKEFQDVLQKINEVLNNESPSKEKGVMAQRNVLKKDSRKRKVIKRNSNRSHVSEVDWNQHHELQDVLNESHQSLEATTVINSALKYQKLKTAAPNANQYSLRKKKLVYNGFEVDSHESESESEIPLASLLNSNPKLKTDSRILDSLSSENTEGLNQTEGGEEKHDETLNPEYFKRRKI